MVLCRAKDYLEVIWQPIVTHVLLWNLMITALLDMIPCRLPQFSTEHLICRFFFLNQVKKNVAIHLMLPDMSLKFWGLRKTPHPAQFSYCWPYMALFLIFDAIGKGGGEEGLCHFVPNRFFFN